MSGATRTSERRERRMSWPGEERGARAGRGRSGGSEQAGEERGAGGGGQAGLGRRGGKGEERALRPGSAVARAGVGGGAEDPGKKR